MKIRKAEEKPVIIHKKKEPGFNNRVIKREENSALPERNSGSAFFYGKYKQGQKNLDNGKVSKIYNQKSIHGNVMEMKLENMPGKEIINTKNNAIKETVIKDTYKKDITAGIEKLTETSVKDTIPASGNKILTISHQKENILPGKARKNSREIHTKNGYAGQGINLKKQDFQGRNRADMKQTVPAVFIKKVKTTAGILLLNSRWHYLFWSSSS